MIDLNLLRITKVRKEYFKVRGRIPASALDAQTNALLADFGHYFESLPEHKRIDHATFLPIFRARHPSLTPEQRATFDTIIKSALTVDVGEAEKDSIMRSLLELRLGTELGQTLARFDAGDLPNIYNEMNTLLEKFKADVGVAGLDWLQDDIGDLLEAEANDDGLRFRLDCLNRHVRGLRPGDFIIVAGRPDRGKTTFIASELTRLVAQMPPGVPALWLNNEGPGTRIIPRLFQAALGATISELVSKKAAGTVKAEYADAVGSADRIRITDVHNQDCFTVESLIERHKPGIVIYDMIDNIRGFGDAARTDLGLEKMYQWARELAVKHNHIGIATSQISGDGAKLNYPSMEMLKDSKTGKQGASDLIIMIGANDDPGFASIRYIGTPKNKLRREGASADPRAAVRYVPDRARYEDIVEAPEDTGDK